MDCAGKLADKIARLPGVAEVQLNFGAGFFRVGHSGSPDEIVKFITSNGYGAQVWNENKDSEMPAKDSGLKARYITAFISGLFLALGMVLEWLKSGNGIDYIFFTISMISGGYFVYKAAINSVRSRVLDINVLMTISSIGAVFIGQWSEAASVVFLFSVGNLIQAHTLEKTRNSISKMIELSPREARVLTNMGTEKNVPVTDVQIGNIVLVKPGEYIPVDGLIEAGQSWVNQAPITGESHPVEKMAGSHVFAGTLNQDGYLKIRVEHTSRDTTLAKMINMVEEAQAKKAPVQQFVDEFAKYYTPSVIIGAAFTVIIPVVFLHQSFSDWFYKSLVLLVISCPCALVISTPVSIVSAIGNAARNGVLIKGGAYLEALARTQNIAFDKTGTLTTGKLVVTGVIPSNGISEEKLLSIAGSIEQYSEHPAAGAIINECQKRKIYIPLAGAFLALPGKGARARINKNPAYIGNERLMNELSFDVKQFSDKAFGKRGNSEIYVASDNELLGMITVSDEPRPEAQRLIRELKKLGINKVTVLSGDNKKTVADLASRLGITSYRGELLPEEKVSMIEELTREGVTIMVGDGVNDAPALAVANVGIAMGAAGTDAALETADIALMNDELQKLPAVIRIGRQTVRIIKQNVAVSVGLKILFLILTLAGISNLWMAVFADTGAAVLVTLNGMRLARYKLYS